MKKMNVTLLCASCTILMAGICGCNATPVRPAERAMRPLYPVHKAVAERRAARLRKIFAPLKVRGAGVSLNSYRHLLAADAEIMALIKKLGFNRIYCHISSESELSDDLRQLIIAASGAGIPVELALRQGDFKHRFRGNALVRVFLPQFRQLPEMAEEIVAFNASLPENAKLSGVTVRFEPHLFTNANGASEIPGLHYLWSVNTFGKGLDNDQLVEISIGQLRMMKAKLGSLPLAVELPDLYPAWKKEGKLTKGSVKDFAGIGKVMLQCTGNVPTQLVQGADAMKEGKDMLAVIPVADHTSVRSGALRRRNWDDLIRTLGYFVNSSRTFNCSGVILRPLSELGYMLLEQD